MRKVCLLVALALVLASSALAMEPNPKLKDLQWFAHNYDCSGIAYASPMAPEHPTRAHVTGEWTLGGTWVRFSYLEIKTPKNPKPTGVRGFFGYDAEIKKFVIGAVDNMGGYATAASDGWNGDTIVFEGPWHLGDRTVPARDTFTKTGAKTMKHVGEMQMDGKWVKYGQETCTRSAK